MIRSLFIVGVGVLLSACTTFMAPESDPALVDKIDSYFGQANNKTYQDSGRFEKPMSFKVGQYVVTGMTSPAEKSVSKTSIVGQEQGGWILEVHSLTPTAESISQMLLVGLETVTKSGSMDDIDIVWIKMKSGDNPVQKIDGVMLSMMESFMRSSISDLVVRTQVSPVDGGAINTPAGTFKGTTKARGEVSFLGNKYSSDTWMHPAVPINGLVKSVTVEDEQTIELLDFGLSGAQRSF